MSDMISNIEETDSLIRYQPKTKVAAEEGGNEKEKMRDLLYPMYIPTIASIVLENKDRDRKLKQSQRRMKRKNY